MDGTQAFPRMLAGGCGDRMVPRRVGYDAGGGMDADQTDAGQAGLRGAVLAHPATTARPGGSPATGRDAPHLSENEMAWGFDIPQGRALR
jgi:hypothetical protein